MSSEGTTNPVAVETVVSDAPEVEVNAPETGEDTSPEVDENGEEIPSPAPVDDTEEVDYEGKKIRVPKEIKGALLRYADYTQKTQQLAEQRKAFEASQLGAESISKDYVDALADVKTYDARLKQYENVDWATLEATDPASAQSHWRTFSQLKDARSAAETTANQKQQALTLEQQRLRATRTHEVQAELQKSLPEWAPGNELDMKLAKFGTANGLSNQDIAEATLRNPAFVKLLNLARIGADLQTKQATEKRITAQQAAVPAVEVGAKASAASDPSRMNADQWRKWRNTQLSKRKT